MKRWATPTALVIAGVFLTQAAWVLAIPPYRGSDEFDHAHRAVGVATGQWRLTEPAEDGRGLLVWVPAANVEAAEGQCDSLTYPGPDNCFSVAEDDGGQARVATAAGGYNPLFYAYMGTAGLVADGAASLYAMRLASLLLCLALIGAAVWTLRSWHTGAWALVGVLAGLSPTLLYSTSVAAPNGPEMAAGLAVWLALLGVRGDADTVERDQRLLLVATVCTPFLVVPRALGPLWFAAIGLTVLVWCGPARVRRIVTRCWRRFVVLVIIAVASAAVNIAWVLGGGGYAGEPDFGGDVGMSVAFKVHAWSLQMVAAFPFRDQPTATFVYPTVLLVMAALVFFAVRARAGWRRWGLVAGLALMVLVPVALNLVTLADRGGEWQGRYALPFVVGLLPMAGVILDGAGFAPVEGVRLRMLAVVMLAISHVGSVVFVTHQELQREVSRLDASWLLPVPWLLGVLVALGWGLHAWALRRAHVPG